MPERGSGTLADGKLVEAQAALGRALDYVPAHDGALRGLAGVGLARGHSAQDRGYWAGLFCITWTPPPMTMTMRFDTASAPRVPN